MIRIASILGVVILLIAIGAAFFFAIAGVFGLVMAIVALVIFVLLAAVLISKPQPRGDPNSGDPS